MKQINYLTKKEYNANNSQNLREAQEQAKWPTGEWMTYGGGASIFLIVKAGLHGVRIHSYVEEKEAKNKQKKKKFPCKITLFNIAQFREMDDLERQIEMLRQEQKKRKANPDDGAAGSLAIT